MHVHCTSLEYLGQFRIKVTGHRVTARSIIKYTHSWVIYLRLKGGLVFDKLLALASHTFKIGKSVTLSLVARWFACCTSAVVAGESSVCPVSGCSIRGIALLVRIRVGKGKCYNRACVATAMPSRNRTRFVFNDRTGRRSFQSIWLHLIG